MADFGISWHLGIDGISLFLVVLTGVLFPIALLGATPHHDAKPYYAWLLLLEAGCLGVFVSLDLFLFFVMFEIVLVPMYFLIGGWGYANRVYAALKFFLFTMFGSALMLVGIVAIAYLHRDAVEDQNRAEAQEILAEPQGEPSAPTPSASPSSRRASPLSFDLVEIAEGRNVVDDSTGANPFDWSAARWIFLAFALAFAVKVPLFPLHTWLPDAHTEAPTAGSVILAGVMLKLGTYGLVRFGLYLFPDAANFFAPALVTLGVIGIIYGAVVATMQKDLKRLVAYSSVAHLGFIVLGTFAITTQGLQGGLLQNINHGLSTGALFLLVGMISERRHTREIAAPARPAEGGADLRRGVHRGDAVVDRPAGAQRVRGRVPGAGRVVPHPALVGGGRRRRRDPRRPLPAVGVPAGVPRRGRRRQQGFPEMTWREGAVHGAAAGADRVPRHLSQAGARADGAGGRPPGRRTSRRTATSCHPRSTTRS